MTREHELGAVIVGTGIGAITHVRALRRAGFEVRAFVGREEAKTAQRAAVYGVPYACSSLEEALALPDVDVVSVTTPPHAHLESVLDATAAGKHVLCEKPFARDLDEARTMLRAAEDTGVVHLLGTEFRFWSPQALMTRVLRDGMIGEPRLVVIVAQMETFVDPEAGMPAWFASAEDGGGWLGGSGSHVLDQIRDSLGEFETVAGSLQTLNPRPHMTADDTFSVHFALRNGVIGMLHSSCATPGPHLRTFKVVGTRGAAWMDGFDIWVDDGDEARVVPVPDDLVDGVPEPPPEGLLATTYDNFHDMGIELPPYTRVYDVMRAHIRGEVVAPDPVAATFADGVALQAVTDAIRESAATRASVNVPSG